MAAKKKKKPAPKKTAKPAPKKAAPAKKVGPTKAAAKKRPGTTAATKAASSKAAKKAAPKKPGPQKSAAKKTAPQKTATKKAAPKKPGPQKAAAKKTAPQKAGPQKAGPQKAAAKKRPGTTAATKAASSKAATKAAATKAGPKATRKAATTPAPKNQPTTRAAATTAPRNDSRDAVPHEIPTKPSGGGRIVQILDEDNPIAALRAYLADLPGDLSIQEGQVALGSAQLMLLPIEREHRGGDEVKELIDLVVSRWGSLPERTGFHAQGFLRNAFAAVGDDRERIDQLIALVPDEPSPELQYNIACAYAYVGDKAAMLDALRAAIGSGTSAEQVRRDNDFIAFADDPDLAALLDGATPEIPVDITPHLEPVRSALDSLVSTLRDFGEHGSLNPPASLDLVLSVERARKIQLPNDFRALLTISDGLKLWANEFFGTKDYRSETKLAQSAREYLASAAGIDECVPIANWGQPTEWLLYDPRGTIRGGAPGYVLMHAADEEPLVDLVEAFERIERIATDELGTN